MKLYHYILIILCAIGLLNLTSFPVYGSSEIHNPQNKYYEKALTVLSEGDFLKSLENANLAIHASELANDSLCKLKSLVFIATLYYITDQVHESHKLLKAINPNLIYKLDHNSRANYYSVSAFCSARIDHDFKTAFRYCDSLETYHRKEKPNDKVLSAMDKNVIAELHILNSDTAQAWNIVRQVDAEMNLTDNELFIQQHLTNKARLYFLSNKLDSAVKYASLMYYTTKPSIIDHLNVLMMLSILMHNDSLHRDLHQYITHRNEYDRIKHVVRANEMKFKMQMIQEEWKAEEIMQQAQNQRKMTTIWIVFLSVVALLAVLIGYLFYRNRKNQHELALLECDRLDNEVSKREMENLRLRDELQDQHSQLDTALQKTAELKVLLATRVNDNPTDGEEVINLLRSTQPDFLPRLRKAHPNLNHNDEVLIAMIRLDLTTADMAAALNITPESLIKARYRLRKKMDIASSKELNQTIMQL